MIKLQNHYQEKRRNLIIGSSGIIFWTVHVEPKLEAPGCSEIILELTENPIKSMSPDKLHFSENEISVIMRP